MRLLKEKPLSQESLKLIACITMLIDHIGVIFVPSWSFMRIIGRISFPIFCFLLVEGFHHTKNARKYGLRLLWGAIISELAFDLAFYGALTWKASNVMVTLFFGFCALQIIHSKQNIAIKVICVILFAVAGEMLHSDYGAFGILLVLLFDLTRNLPYKTIILIAGMGFLFYHIGGIALWGVLAIIPITLYSSVKRTYNKAIQWAFYLFYPVHLLVLYIINFLITSM